MDLIFTEKNPKIPEFRLPMEDQSEKNDRNLDNDFQGSYLASVRQTFEGNDARFDRNRRDRLEHVAHHPVRNANRSVTVNRKFFSACDSSGKPTCMI